MVSIKFILIAAASTLSLTSAYGTRDIMDEYEVMVHLRDAGMFQPSQSGFETLVRRGKARTFTINVAQEQKMHDKVVGGIQSSLKNINNLVKQGGSTTSPQLKKQLNQGLGSMQRVAAQSAKKSSGNRRKATKFGA